MTHPNYNIKHLNSFGLNCTVNKLIEINREEDLNLIKSNPVFLSKRNIILGLGSNSVFVNDYFNGTILLIKNKGIKIIEEDKDSIIIEAYSGEDWNDLVNFACDNSWWGIENLAAVPSSVGAAIVQNIGAYGQEIKDSFLCCTTYNPQTDQWKEYNNEECKFDYRYSIFKYQTQLEIIWKIRLKLSKKPKLNITYSAIKEKIESEAIEITNPKQMSQLVTQIRNSKLPNPKELPNAGSFFKNPVISQEHFNYLKEIYPQIPSYPSSKGIKIAAGWLIEQAGWKAKRVGNVGMHEKQALVMVNYGNAIGEEIVNLAQEIEESIKNIFNINLEKEVHIIL